MSDVPSFSDLFNIARDEALAKNARLAREAVERDGADANVMLAGAAAVGDEVVGQIADVASGLYLDSAAADPTGLKLDRLVFDRYGLVRKAAAPAMGSVQFSLPNPAGAPFTIPRGTALQTSDGRTFLTTQDGLFLAGTSALLVIAQSAVAGADQQASAGTITSITGAVAGAPTGLTVTNLLATAGAADKESNADLANRARAYFANARRGTLGAIESAALGVPGIEKATAFEMLDALGRPSRMVQLVVADAFTEQFADYSQVPPLYAAQSLAITQAVYAGLYDARAAGIYVQVVLATVQLQAVSLALTFFLGADVDLTATMARAAIVNYVNGLKPGAPFVRADAQAALAAVPGLDVTGNEIASPAGDVDLQPLQVIRTSLALVSTTSTQANRPLTVSTNPDAYTQG